MSHLECFLNRVSHLVVSQGINATLKRHERLIDVVGLHETRSLIVSALCALRAGQINDTELGVSHILSGVDLDLCEYASEKRSLKRDV